MTKKTKKELAKIDLGDLGECVCPELEYEDDPDDEEYEDDPDEEIEEEDEDEE